MSLKDRDTRGSPCFNNILMRGPNWVGDAVLAIPAMKAVRAQFPKAEITLMVRPWVSGLFTSAPFVDRVWTEAKPAGFSEWARISREIRSREFDMALLFPNSFESALMMFLARVPERVGYARDGRSWMLTNMIWPPAREQHQVHYYLDLANAVDQSGTGDRNMGTAPDVPKDGTPAAVPARGLAQVSLFFRDTRACPPFISATADEKAAAWKLLAAEGVPAGSRFMVLNPGAAYGSAKRWSEDRFAEAGGRLADELGLHIVVVGSEIERPIAEQIANKTKSPTAILNGKTSLETLIGVLSESSLMLTNDSGPMHIAAALGTPTVAVFGSTNEVETGPYGPKTRVVRHQVECSPCMLRTCPIDHRCMTLVTADDVCRAAKELLAHA